MTTRQPAIPLDDQLISVRAKLAAAWTSFMFLYAYVDIIAFTSQESSMTSSTARSSEFTISQSLLTTFIALMAIPIMIVLSVILPARANRTTNLIVASVQIPYAAFNVVGVLDPLLRTWPRTGSDPARLHCALRLDLAPDLIVSDQPGP